MIPGNAYLDAYLLVTDELVFFWGWFMMLNAAGDAGLVDDTVVYWWIITV